MASINGHQQSRLTIHGHDMYNHGDTLPEPEVTSHPPTPPPKYTMRQEPNQKYSKPRGRFRKTHRSKPTYPEENDVPGKKCCNLKYSTIGLAMGLAVALAAVIGLLAYVLDKELGTSSGEVKGPCDRNNGGCSQTCTETGAGPICSCQTGYTLTDGFNCADINECGDAFPRCHHNCINNPGSYQCTCNTGYQLDWDLKTCVDIDECSTSNGGCDQTCTNTVGSFACSCSTGWTLNANKFSCDDINECLTNNGGCSDICNNTPGSYFCSCSDWHKMLPDNHTCQVCLSSVTYTGSGPIDCQDIYDHGHNISGSCALCINAMSISAYCDMDTTNDVGWTGFQRRVSGAVDFYQKWATYEAGFGDPADSFWLGLTHIHNLTTARTYHLQIDLTDQSGTNGSAYYSTFSVGDASSKYVLSIGGNVPGSPVDAKDSMYTTVMPTRVRLNDRPFSTYDIDNDAKAGGNCAVNTGGGWWHNDCSHSNLNARWNPTVCAFNVVNWRYWHNNQCSMSYILMKLKRM